MIGDKTAEVDFIRSALSLAEENPGRFNAECAADGVTPVCFTNPRHWRIYEAAKRNARSGQYLTPATLGAMLPQDRDSISSVWPVVPHFGGYKTMAAKLREYAARRAAFDIGRRIQDAAENPGEDLSGSLVRAASALQSAYSSDGTGIVTGQSVLESLLDELERAQLGTETPTIETGIAEWDLVMGGLEKGIVTILGGYPGMRKTALAATMAGNMSFRGVPVGYISLEDRPENIAKRYMSRETGISVKDLTRRRLSEFEMEKIGTGIDGLQRLLSNLHFDGRKGLTGAEVAASARFMVAEKGAKVVVVDLLTEIRPSMVRKDRYDLEIGDAVELLRNVASEMNVAVVVLAHLSRNADKESALYTPPTMFSFSDSSMIEKRCKAAAGLYGIRGEAEFTAIRGLKMMNGDAAGKTFYLQHHTESALFRNINSRQPSLPDSDSDPYN